LKEEIEQKEEAEEKQEGQPPGKDWKT
jgi:hypothetical protein